MLSLWTQICCVLSEFTCCFKTCWTCLFMALKCSKGGERVRAKKQLQRVRRVRVHQECLWFQTCDTGPFSDIRLLEKKPAHMAVLLHYLISNSDPCALVRSFADCLLHCSGPLLSVSCVPLLSVSSTVPALFCLSVPLLTVSSTVPILFCLCLSVFSAVGLLHCSGPLLSVSCVPLFSVSSTVPALFCLSVFLLSVSSNVPVFFCLCLSHVFPCCLSSTFPVFFCLCPSHVCPCCLSSTVPFFFCLCPSVSCVPLLSVCSTVPFPVLSQSLHPSSSCCLSISVALCLSSCFFAVCPCVFSSFCQPFSVICPCWYSPAFCFLFGLCFCPPVFPSLHNLSCVFLFLLSLSLCFSVHLPLSSVAVHLCCSVSLSKSSVLYFSFSTLWRIPTSSQQATQKIYANGDTRFSPPSLLVLLWVQTCT